MTTVRCNRCADMIGRVCRVMINEAVSWRVLGEWSLPFLVIQLALSVRQSAPFIAITWHAVSIDSVP